MTFRNSYDVDVETNGHRTFSKSREKAEGSL